MPTLPVPAMYRRGVRFIPPSFAVARLKPPCNVLKQSKQFGIEECISIVKSKCWRSNCRPSSQSSQSEPPPDFYRLQAHRITGVVVPMPTLPLFNIVTFSVGALSVMPVEPAGGCKETNRRTSVPVEVPDLSVRSPPARSAVPAILHQMKW